MKTILIIPIFFLALFGETYFEVLPRINSFDNQKIKIVDINFITNFETYGPFWTNYSIDLDNDKRNDFFIVSMGLSAHGGNTIYIYLTKFKNIIKFEPNELFDGEKFDIIFLTNNKNEVCFKSLYQNYNWYVNTANFSFYTCPVFYKVVNNKIEHVSSDFKEYGRKHIREFEKQFKNPDNQEENFQYKIYYSILFQCILFDDQEFLNSIIKKYNKLKPPEKKYLINAMEFIKYFER